MKTLLLLLFTTATLLGQGGSYCSYMLGDPRLYANKFGLVAYYGLFDTNSITLNGAGESKVIDKSWKAGRLENLLLQSSQFSTTWTLTKCNAFGATDTGAAGAGSFANTARTTDPLGGNTADFIQEDATASTFHYANQASVTLSPGSYSLSVYAKTSGRNWLLVDMEDGANYLEAFFDITNGVAGSSFQGGDWTGKTSSITSVGNGWFKCEISGTRTTQATVAFVRLWLAASDGGNSYSGDNTSGLFLWGAQLRRSTSSSTYYATTTVVEDASRDLLQGTAANQPLVSRSDNKGNLLVQSSVFSTTWTRNRLNAFGATDTGATGAGSFANTARTTDPLGGNTADFIQEDATAANNHYIAQTLAGIGFTNFSASLYVKSDARTKVRVYATATAYAGLDVDLSALTATNFVSSGNIVSSSVVDAGNGWVSISYSGNAAFASTTPTFVIMLLDATGTNVYDGDNTSGLFLWGASLRQSTWDSDYIATTSTIAVPGLNGKTTAYFDGANHYLKTAAFTLNQPTTVVWVGKQVTWTTIDRLWDGFTVDTLVAAQRLATPGISIRAASYATENTDLAIGSYGILSAIFNGASSSLSVNNKAPTTGDIGAGNAGGFTLGATASAAQNGNIQVYQVLLFNRVLAAGELAAIKKWAQGIGGTALAF